MRRRSASLTVCTALATGALFLAGAAMAQQTQPGAAGGTPPSGQSGATTGQPGVTSGPAAGTPATLGTGGTTPASPHQMHTVHHRARSVSNEHKGQAGGTGMHKVHAKRGTESGPAPKTPQNAETGAGQGTSGAGTNQ